MANREESKNTRRTFAEWTAIVMGWLACAAACLWLSLKLEAYPAAYDTFFPFVLLMLFGNVFVFYFIASRWSGQPRKLYNSVLRVFIGEALLLAGIFALGRYALG